MALLTHLAVIWNTDSVYVICYERHIATHLQATNVDFANRLYNSSEVSGSKRFSKPKLSQTGFAIEHYAGGVGYKTDHFLIKNRDFVVAEHQQLMQSSDQPFVCMLFPAEPEAPAADGNTKVRQEKTK